MKALALLAVLAAACASEPFAERMPSAHDTRGCMVVECRTSGLKCKLARRRMNRDTSVVDARYRCDYRLNRALMRR